MSAALQKSAVLRLWQAGLSPAEIAERLRVAEGWVLHVLRLAEEAA